MSGAQLDSVLTPDQLLEPVRIVSSDGAFRYTLRNLYFAMVRSETWPGANGGTNDDLERFGQAIRTYESTHGPLAGRIADDVDLPEPDLDRLDADIQDYTVRRVLVFDRPQTFLLFALNGFHRRIEVGFVLWPQYPRPFWETICRHLREGTSTTFYALHDCNQAGYALAGSVHQALTQYGPLANVVDIGLRFQQAFYRGLTVSAGPVDVEATSEVELPQGGPTGDFEEAMLLLRSGNYAYVEEMPPLDMMRWAHHHIASRQHDVGFG